MWLDAGIVPFSTLGWENPEWIEGGYATGAARGLSRRRPSRPRVLGAVVPGRLGLGDARADPPVVLLAALHVGRPDRPGPVPRGPQLREDARRARPRDARLVGQPHRGRGRVRPHGRRRHALAVLRPAAEPEPAGSATGPGTRSSASCSRCGTRSRSSSSTRTSRASARRSAISTAVRAAASLPLDRWLVARTAQLVEEAAAGYDASLTVAVLGAYDAFVDDLSNWYIRRSRRRFWSGDRAALATLWHALVQSLRVIAPVLPFLAEHLWQNLVAGVAEDVPDSVFLAGWPEPGGRRRRDPRRGRRGPAGHRPRAARRGRRPASASASRSRGRSSAAPRSRRPTSRRSATSCA